LKFSFIYVFNCNSQLLVMFKRSAKRQGKKKVVRKMRQGIKPTASATAVQARQRPPKGRNSFQRIGSSIGSLVSPAAGVVAGGVGGVIDRIMGRGSYKVKRNTVLQGGPPVFKDTGHVFFSNREYLGDISSTTAFSNTAFSINPGISSTFPILSSIAQNFEMYDMHGLVFEFKSTSADALNSTNTALGTVIMATSYDSIDANFTTKQQMDNYEFATSSRPSDSMLHAVECSPKLEALSKRYVRSGGVPTGADSRFYDVGTFQIATVGSQAAAVVGELWVSYHVELMHPKLGPTSTAFYSASTAPVTGNALTGLSAVYSSMPVVAGTNTLRITGSGRYLVVNVNHSTTTYSAGSFSASSGATLASVAGSVGSPYYGNGTSDFAVLAMVDVVTAGTLTFTSPNVVGTGTGFVYIVQVPNTFAAPAPESLEHMVKRMIDVHFGDEYVEWDTPGLDRSEPPVQQVFRSLLPPRPLRPTQQ
jgi:hypothetical protein